MVKVRNVVDNGKIISMECYIEGDLDRHFHLELDKNTLDVVKDTHNEFDAYVAHARWNIKEYIEKGEPIPKAFTSMWC